MKKEEGNKPDVNLLNITPDSPFSDNMDIIFTDETTEVQPVKKEEEEKETTEVIETGGEAKKTEETPDAKVEKKEEKEEKEEKTETTETEEEDQDNGLQTFAAWLNDKGVVELEEGKTVESEEDLQEVISTTINKGIEKYKNSHPEEVQKFIEFVDNGGNPRDFHRLYYEEASWKDADIENESHQEEIIRATYSKAGMDKDDIESQIQDLKDLGKLDSLAKKMLPKLIAEEDKDKQSLLEAQKEYQNRQKELAKKQWDDFKDNLFKKEEVNGFKLTPKLKTDLWDYMTKVDKTGKTALQKHNETNQDAQILYAYLAMNNWDISKLEKQVKTRVTSELQKVLKNVTDNRSKLKGSSDSFKDKTEKNDFSAFRKAIDNNLI